MSRARLRIRLPGETESERRKRLDKVRDAEAAAKRKQRERRSDETDEQYHARMEQLRQLATERQRRSRERKKERSDGGVTVSSLHTPKNERHSSVESRGNAGRSDEAVYAARIGENQAENAGVFDDNSTVDSTSESGWSDMLSYQNVTPTGLADVVSPSVGGGKQQTSATGAVSLRQRGGSEDSEARHAEVSLENQPNAPRSAKVISLFAAGSRGRSDDDRAEYERELLGRFFAAEAELAETRALLAKLREEMRELQAAFVAIRRDSRDADGGSDAGGVTEELQPEPQQAAPEPVGAPPFAASAEVSRETTSGLVALWQIRSHQQFRTRPRRMTDLEELALEQVWLQALECAQGQVHAAEELFGVWVDKFFAMSDVAEGDRTPEVFCVRSHLFPRRLSQGLYENWPPKKEEIVVPMYSFEEFRAEYAEWFEPLTHTTMPASAFARV
jgi:hypothetical protein